MPNTFASDRGSDEGDVDIDALAVSLVSNPHRTSQSFTTSPPKLQKFVRRRCSRKTNDPGGKANPSSMAIPDDEAELLLRGGVQGATSADYSGSFGSHGGREGQ